MERGGSEYCGDDGIEFSLPDGVDLVGIDSKSSLNKNKYSTQQPQHQHHSNENSNKRTKSSGVKSAFKLLCINLFVCALVLSYALLGSFIFISLEGGGARGGPYSQNSPNYQNPYNPQNYPNSHNYPPSQNSQNSPNGRKVNLSAAILNVINGAEVGELRNETVKNIWDITLSMNILYQDNWTRLTADELTHFQKVLFEKIIEAVESSVGAENNEGAHWTFPRAFLFALTTLTTIGYGGVGPRTSSAKIGTMIYAIFGIPIMLWYLSNVGSLFAKIIRFICSRIFCCSPSPPPSTNKNNENYYTLKQGTESGSEISHVPTTSHSQSVHTSDQNSKKSHKSPKCSIILIVFLSLVSLVGYIIFGSYVISRWEKWRFLDSFYFCFLTLTTISFGEIRGGRHGTYDKFQSRTEWFCSFYILFGMALTSMFFNILHEEISGRYKRWKEEPVEERPQIETKEHSLQLATVNRTIQHNHTQTLGRRPESNAHNPNLANSNSYSVHFMNFNSPSSRPYPHPQTHSIPNNEHCGTLQKNRNCDPNGGGYEEEEMPGDYIVAHPIPPPREIYGSHPVFPR